MKLQTKMKIFFSNGGATRFRDRIAKSMGLKKDQIKVTSVTEGSVIVSYQLTLPEGENDAERLANLKKKNDDIVKELGELK